jgi:cytochrome c556
MRLRTYAIASLLVAATGLAAFAHSGATGIVKERMELMKGIAAQMKTVARMIKGERAFDAEKAVSAARTIADHAERIPEKFPENSIKGMSEATPAIWENWDEFVAITDELKTKADALSAAAEAAPDAAAIRPEFKQLGGTCMSCHEDFRDSG